MKAFCFIVLIGFLIPPNAFSQEKQMGSLVDLNRGIAADAFNQTIEDPKKPLPGNALRAIIESKPEIVPGACSNVNDKKSSAPPKNKDEKTDRVEVLLIVDGTTADQGKIEKTPEGLNTSYSDLETNITKLNNATTTSYHSVPAPTSLDSDTLKKWVEYGNDNYYHTPGGNPFSEKDKSLYVEAIVQTIPKMGNISDKDLASQMASAIGAIAKTDEEKYQLLSMLSSRLYENYNDARNPGYNNTENNPDKKPLPTGTLSLSGIFTAAANQDESQGGVCNDISEAIAKVGEDLFPKKDVLVINSGTHFAVLVTDKDGSKVIDANDQTDERRQLNLGTGMDTGNIRISKVVGGHLKEIAVMDTQLGDLVKSTTGSPVPQLKSGANFNKSIAQAKLILTENEKKKRALTIAGGTGSLLESNAYVIAAKYTSETSHAQRYVTIGADEQQWKAEPLKSLGNEYHINLGAGFDRRLIRYVNPKVKITFTSGVHMNSSVALNQGFVDIYGSSGSLDLINKLDVQSNNKDPLATKFRGQVILDNAFGPKNWGATTGATSTFTAPGTLKALSNMNFHLNQVTVMGSASNPLTQNTSFVTNGMYQGSNVGQAASLISGIQVQTNSGASIFYFVGAETTKLKGFQTKNSLLVGGNGLKTGVNFVGKNGRLSGGAGVSNIAPGQSPQFDASARYNIGIKKKKSTPAFIEE